MKLEFFRFQSKILDKLEREKTRWKEIKKSKEVNQLNLIRLAILFLESPFWEFERKKKKFH